MLRTVFLSLIVLVCLSSATLLRKSLSRRQTDGAYCQAIEGFDCKCSPYRVSCTTDRSLPQSVTVLPQEREKHSSLELVINSAQAQNVHEYTFDQVKQIFKPDADYIEFRVKFENFASLNLPAGAFNRVFPDNSHARKTLALEIYNQQVQPNDNVNLFSNLNVDSLELYATYPFQGTFQQLFNGANIKYLRLTGADIRSDPSQSFTGNIGRLELARHASELTSQIFPMYPAHELIANAYSVAKIDSDNPPNYSNLGELSIHSVENIPANAFRNFPNLQALTITGDRDIDPHAFDGLHRLEKLSVKGPKLSADLLNNLPAVKEFEVDLDKLDERAQCQLVEKVANGQTAVLGSSSRGECTCALDYLNSAAGQYPCGASNCDQSSCAAIKNNYDTSKGAFKAAPAIQRADGSDAFRPRPPKVYNGPYQVSSQDQAKSQESVSSNRNEQNDDNRHDQGAQEHHYHPDANQGENTATPEGGENRDDGNEDRQDGEGNENRREGEGNENRQEGDGHAHHGTVDSNQVTDAMTEDGTDVPPSTKRKLGWLPIIIIIAAVAGLLLIGLIVLLLRRRRAAAGYNAAATSEHGAAQTTRA